MGWFTIWNQSLLFNYSRTMDGVNVWISCEIKWIQTKTSVISETETSTQNERTEWTVWATPFWVWKQCCWSQNGFLPHPSTLAKVKSLPAHKLALKEFNKRLHSEISEDKSILRQSHEHGLSRSENAAGQTQLHLSGDCAMGQPRLLINELHVTGFQPMHSGRVPHSLLASGGPR